MSGTSGPSPSSVPPPPHSGSRPSSVAPPRFLVFVLLALLLPAPSLADATLDALALAALAEPESLDGGFVIGPPESRATWYFLGALRPLDGDAMAVFSTGDLSVPPDPGTDLGAVGAPDDVAGMTLVLEAPPWARSLRYAVRFVGSPGSDDLLRVTIQGDEQAIDPDGGASLSGTTTLLDPRSPPALEGSLWDGTARVTPWIEQVVAVPGGHQVHWSVTIEDRGDAVLDSAVLVDGVRWDHLVPDGPRAGVLPWLDVPPSLAVDNACERPVDLPGRDLQEGSFHLEDPAGATVPAEVTAVTGERLRFVSGGLPEGNLDLVWIGQATSLRWPALLESRPAPSALLRADPPVISAAGGALVRILGSGLGEVQAVEVGGAAVAFTSTSCESLEFLAPAGEPGPADVRVTTGGAAVTLTAAFLRSGPPQGTPVPPPPVLLGGDCAVAGRTAAPAVGLLLPVLLRLLPRFRRFVRPDDHAPRPS